MYVSPYTKKALLFWLYSLSIFECKLLGERKLIVKLVIFGGGNCCYFCKLWYNLMFSLPKHRILELRRHLKWPSLTFSDSRSVCGGPKPPQMMQVGQATSRWQSWYSDPVYCFCRFMLCICFHHKYLAHGILILTFCGCFNYGGLQNFPRINKNNQEFSRFYIFHPKLWTPH